MIQGNRSAPAGMGAICIESRESHFDTVEGREFLHDVRSMPASQRDALFAIVFGERRRTAMYPSVSELSRRTGRSEAEIRADASSAADSLRRRHGETIDNNEFGDRSDG